MALTRNRNLVAVRCRGRQHKRSKRAGQVRYSVHWGYPIAFVSAIAFLMILYLTQCAQVISVQYNSTNLKERKKVLLKEQASVKLEIEELSSLERIEKIAKDDLKMVFPERRLTLTLKDTASPTDMAADVNQISGEPSGKFNFQ